MKKQIRGSLPLSILAMIVTVFLAFCVFGAPHRYYVNPAHFGEGLYVMRGDVLVLNEDVVGVAEGGDEILFTKGQRIEVSSYDPEDNSPVVFYYSENLDHGSYTLHGADYEDITEEVKSEAEAKSKQIKEEGRRLNREYRRKMALWFLYNGDEIYSATGERLDTVDGSFESGFKGAGVLLIFEVLFLSVCLLKKKTYIFLTATSFLFGCTVTGMFIAMIFHPTCR